MVDPTDLSSALTAASLNTVLWGGTYNPIVPSNPDTLRDGLLTAFDPDMVVNLTGSDLPPALSSFQRRVITPKELVAVEDLTGRRDVGFGFSMVPIVRHVYDTEVRFSKDPGRLALIEPESSEGWPEFVAFAYGSPMYLPPIDRDYFELYRDILRARTIALSSLTAPHDYQTVLSPIEFTGYGLRRLGGSANFSSHVVLIGDHRSLDDLVQFWNIRATGRTVLFVPIGAYQHFENQIRALATAGQYMINEKVENYADVQRAPSVSVPAFDEVTEWIRTLDLNLSRRDWQPRYGVYIDRYVGDINVAELESARGEEISLLEGGRMTPVKLLSPAYLQNVPGRGSYTWATEIGMTGGYREEDFMFSFPNESAVEDVVGQSFGAMRDEIRLGVRGIIHQPRHSRISTLFVSPVRTKDVFEALFREVGVASEPSHPGQYAEQIIKKMDSLSFGCRVFKIRGVREVLDKLGNGSTLTKGNIRQIIMSDVADEYGVNWRPDLYTDLVIKTGRRGFDFTSVFDLLLENRVLRPGFDFRCLSCFKEDWYHVSQFAEEYVCRFCFSQQRVKFGSTKDWQYKADGLFQIRDSGEGSIAVILSLWRLHQISALRHGRYVTSRHLLLNGKRFCEIDYAYVLVNDWDSSYDLVLGQATRFGDFTDADMQIMRSLADRFRRKPFLAFSTLRDKYSAADQARLRQLAEDGYKVIALTREELDPYDLFTRFEAAPHKYAVSLDDFAENTRYLNLSEPEA